MIEDGLWVVFLLNDQVLVPTMAKTKAGFYMGIEPVEVASTRDRVAVEQAIVRAVERRNGCCTATVAVMCPHSRRGIIRHSSHLTA